MSPTLARSLLGLSLLAAAAGAQQEIVFGQLGNTTGFGATVESGTPGFFGQPLEAADDFDVVGSIERVWVNGYGCFQCSPPTVLGVHVRFYEWTASGPGALQASAFVPAGDPGLLYDEANPSALDITLPLPFAASGQHFLSVQVEFDGGGYWSWWVANHVEGAHGSTLLQRSGAGPWEVVQTPVGPLLTDLGFVLWGTDATPPAPGTDPHGEWVVVPTPDPPTDHALFREIEVLANDDVWAVGDWSNLVQPPFNSDIHPLAMHWDGSAWTQIDPPFQGVYVGGNWCDLQAIEAAAPDDIWAGGGCTKQGPDGFVGTHLYVARWDGDSWAEIPAPKSSGASGNYIDDIEVIGPDEVWFVGDWMDVKPTGGVDRQGLAMRWNGSSFQVFDVPVFGNVDTGLEAVSALSSNEIWAVGGGHDNDYTNTSTIFRWNGSAWQHVPGPAPGWFHRLYAVEAIASDDVWACGDYQDASGYHVFFIHWDGSSWSMVDADAQAGGYSLEAFGPDEIYSSGGGIARWDGTSWQQVASFPTIFAPAVLALDSAGTPQTLWAAGREVVASDLLTLAVRLVSDDTWASVPVGAGDDAPAPLLLGEGTPSAGQPVTLTLAGAPPSAPALLVAGGSALLTPLKGGLLVPAPDALLPLPPTSSAGGLVLPATWPAGLPLGTSVWLQAWTSGPGGWTGSDGLRATVP